jgi:hypothetical protein
LARAVIAEVVHVHAVNDVVEGALAPHLFQPREQLVLAVETAVGIVPRVIRVLEFAGFDVLVSDAELRDERLGIAFVRFRNGSGIGRDRQRSGTHRAVCRPRQVGRIRAAGKSYQHAAHVPQDFEEPLFFIPQARRIGKFH